MNASMALMLTALYSRLRSAIVASYIVLAIFLLAQLLLTMRHGSRSSRQAGNSLGTAAYHLFAITAMLGAIHLMPVGSAVGVGSASMGMDMPAAGSQALPPSALARSLGLLFLLDGVVTLALVLFAPAWVLALGSQPGPSRAPGTDRTRPGAQSIASLRWGVSPHVIMDLGMFVMLA